MPALLGAIVSVCFVVPAVAAGPTDVPPGVPAGPWILSPLLEVGYASDTNVFYTAENEGPISDTVLTTAPSIVATLPFRNSLFRMDYEWVRTDYGTVSISRDLSRDYGADLALKFSTLDQLRLKARETLGVAFSQVDQGGSAVFQGEPYDLSTYTAELAREEYGHRGYVVRLTRETLNFPPEVTVAYFEYSGYTGFAEYKEPRASHLWLVGSYEGRRYDNFSVAGPNAPSVLYRREHSDLLWAGIQGLLGPDEPYTLRGGWADFRFPGGAGTGFRGFVLDGTMQLHVGAATRVHLAVSRRPWPAYFYDDNYYLTESLTARIERFWLRSSGAGIEATAARYSYEPLPLASPDHVYEAGFVRKDTGLRMQVYANLFISDQLGFKLNISRDTRDSTDAGARYGKTVYYAGVVLGWRADAR